MLLTHLGGNRRWVPLILAWYQASHAQWEIRVKKTESNTKNMGERGEPSGRPEVATLSHPQITSRFASLAYFSPNGESGPGFKYEFINRLPLPRFFFQVLVNEQEENIHRH